MSIEQPELSPKEKMQTLLQDIELNKAKESLKQDKATTTQLKIQSELFEQAAKLNGQTESVVNVTNALAIAENIQNMDWADDPLKRQAVHLLKDAMKRARASYK